MQKRTNTRTKLKRDARHWGTTIFMGICALLSWYGIYLVWQILGGNIYITVTVTLFLCLFAVMFTIGAIDGRKKRYHEIFDDLLHMFPLWP